ncbi:MAG: thioredoxin family protein [Candidatus Zipacnadales bacterium]
MEICCDVNKMVRHPDLRSRYDAFTPPPEVVQALRAIRDETTVVIVFGFWCPDSMRIVPEVLKAITEADNPNLQVLAATVPLEETYELPLSLGGISVRRFPTVLFVKGRYQKVEDIPVSIEELARFVEEPLKANRLSL